MSDNLVPKKVVDFITGSIPLRNANRYDESLACLDEALEIAPDCLPALIYKGNLLREMARFEEAATCFERSIRSAPNKDEIGRLLISTLQEALDYYDRIAATSPENTELPLKRGNVLLRLRRYEEAIVSYDHYLSVHPEDADGWNNRGNALLELDRVQEALESYDRALEIRPHAINELYNRGNVLQQLGRFEEALVSYDRVLEQKPDMAEAVMEQSRCRLAMGECASGWLLQESRWQTDQMKGTHLASTKPVWLGERNIGGKTILLWAEQGFGDTIQFLRYVPQVVQRAGLVYLRVPEALRSLCETLKCTVPILTDEESIPPHDLHCPLMSLPIPFGTTLNSIPADVPYINADPARIANWQDLLGPRSKPRIGLVWAGRRNGNRTRDMRLESLLPLTLLNVDLINLQKEIPKEDRGALAGMPELRSLGILLSDFADTAALLENLDLVISVDTAVAHLAGALGMPVWLMLRHSGEWRWLRERADSPWYPSMRIFRQKAPGDWTGVVGEIMEQLRKSFGPTLE